MPPIPNAAYLCAWACLSVATSAYNKWVLGRLAFNFPIVLSFAHMTGAALALHAYLACKRGTWDGRKQQQQQTYQHRHHHHALRPADLEKAGCTVNHGPTPVGWAQDPAWWLRHHGHHILTIAIMFAASVCLRNSAFAGLPLPVMQLLGSCAPLASYTLSVAVGLAPLAWPGLVCIIVCVCGVATAVSGRPTVSYSGHALARQAVGVGLEVCRSIVLQLFIRKVVAEREGGGEETAHPPVQIRAIAVAAATASPPLPPPPPHSELMIKSGPLTIIRGPPSSPSPPLPTILLAMYAPVCAVMLALPAAAFEADRALADAAGRPPWFWAALAGNLATALALNLAAVTCLQKVGVVALSLTGFAKDWGLVVVSTIVFGTEVSPRFVVGMLVTTGAVGVYGSMRRRG
jgi:hypothetical protein